MSFLLRLVALAETALPPGGASELERQKSLREFAATAIVIVLGLFAVQVIADLVRRRRQGEPIVPTDRIDLRAADAFDLYVCLAVWFFAPVLALNGLVRLGLIDKSMQKMAGTVALMAGGLAVAVYVFIVPARRHKLTLAEVGLSAKGLGTALVTGLKGAVVAVPLMLAVGSLVAIVVQKFGGKPVEQEVLKEIVEGGKLYPRWFQALLIAYATALAPVVEECLFRGVIMRYLRRVTPWPWVAMAGSALLFSMAHLAGSEAPLASSLHMLLPLFILGMLLAIAFERTGSLWAPIVMHAAYNSVSLALAMYIAGRM